MIQIEVTTSCNLSCEYCFRNDVVREGRNVDLEVVEKVSNCDDEFVLYGFGEPLMNKEIPKIVKMLDGKITLSTNGLMDVGSVVEFVDRIGISIDSVDERVLNSTRKGADLQKINENLKKIGDKGLLEVVITRDNFDNLKSLVEFAGEHGADVSLSNAVAPNWEIYEKVIYFEGSRRVAEIVGDLRKDFIVRVIQECAKGSGENFKRYKDILKEVNAEGYQLNLSSLIDFIDRVKFAFKAEKILEQLSDVAKDYGIELFKPAFFGDSKNRVCPYKNSLFVKVDGSVSSCMELASKHTEVVNNHEKTIEPYITGSFKTQEYDEIISNLREFEKLREDMNNFPWCADCPHVSGCWYTMKNEDCYTNYPSCSECLYSSDIAKCFL
jgi:MoaA/NifB/PqqE/SkfB family radical SAM enzyme